MINQNWLRTYCTLVEIGHFTQTAEKLFMTQSGVSQHIKKLEQQLGCPLLLRDGKSFSLTSQGHTLYQQGQKLLRDTAMLANSIKQDDPHVGIVNIMSPGSIGLKLYPHLIAIQQKHQGLVINYTFSPNHAIEIALNEHQCDIGLMSENSKLTSLTTDKITTEPLVVVTPKNITKISWQTLLDLGFVSHPDGAHHAKQLLSENFSQFTSIDQFESKGFSNQISLILLPVSQGLGFSVLPLYAAQAFALQELINIHPLTTSVSEPLYLCRNQSALDQKRHQFIRDEIRQFVNLST